MVNDDLGINTGLITDATTSVTEIETTYSSMASSITEFDGVQTTVNYYLADPNDRILSGDGDPNSAQIVDDLLYTFCS